MKSRRFGIVLSIAVIVGALALMVFRWPAASEAVYPAERLVLLSRGAIRNCLSGILSGASAVAENARLRREVAGLSLLRGDVARLTAENARLRRALDFRARQPGAWLAANVLSSGGGAAAARRSIRVDKGTLAGVRAGSAVVVPEGLVGRVTAVSPHTSEVTLVTDPSVKVSCAIGSGAASCVHGILSGGDSDGLFLRHLAPAADMEPQSRVFTSGRGGVFPPGIDIGTLLLVTNGVRGVEGEVLPSVDYSALEVVFIRSGQ